MDHSAGKQGQLKTDKITQLQNRLAQQQQSLFRSSAFQSDTAVCASYGVSEMFTKKDETFR
jgi:hypothetical protein